MDLAKGWCGEREGMCAFPFSAQILYLRLRCQTLFVNRNGFRPAQGGFEVERLFHVQNDLKVSQRFDFGHGKGLPIC